MSLVSVPQKYMNGSTMAMEVQISLRREETKTIKDKLLNTLYA